MGKLNVDGTEIQVLQIEEDDDISLTDMVRKINNGPALIEKWLRNKNTIEYLSLHDCQCSRLYYADTTLIFEMEWMEVLATHPNNPFDKSYQSTKGKIILLNPVVEIGRLLTDVSQRDESMSNIEDVDISDFEVLDFIEESNSNEYKLKLFGQFDAYSKYDFIQMSIKYSSSKVMFNELTEVSWFEDKCFFLKQ